MVGFAFPPDCDFFPGCRSFFSDLVFSSVVFLIRTRNSSSNSCTGPFFFVKVIMSCSNSCIHDCPDNCIDFPLL